MELNISSIRSILFVMFVTILIPSVTCSFFILYHFARSQELRKRLNNHVILMLLLTNFIQVTTDMPLTLITLHTGFVPVQTNVFCLAWCVYNYTICVIGLILMAYGCIERYFLIFHRPFFKKHLILLHYGPLVFLLIYPPILYTGLIVLYSCENYFDYTQFTCGGACYSYEFGLGLYDWLCNVFTPIFIGTIATTALIVRVILQKRRVGQRAIWQRNRKMVLQLSSVSIMYIIVWIPNIVCYVVSLISFNSFAIELASTLVIYFEYISCLLCPFMCLFGLPEVRHSIKQIYTRFNTVQPIIQTIGQPPVAPRQPQLEQNRTIRLS